MRIEIINCDIRTNNNSALYNILQVLYYNKLYIKEFFINMNINCYYEYYFGKMKP